jgi:hypothetical protein
MASRVVEITGGANDKGWLMHVTVSDRTRTTHVVRISRAELDRYGGGEVTDLVRRSFDFLLDREPNTAILREFDLGTIERYFPEYAAAMTRR